MLSMFEGLLKPSTLIAIVAAIAIALYLYFLDKRTKSDEAAALCKKYAKMTEDLLAATPDEEVVRAVVANLMNKQDKRRPDAAAQLPLLSRGRAAVYSVWLLCHELESQDFTAVFRSPSRRFVDPAVDGFERIGASNTATALRAAIKALDEDESAPLLEAVTTVFREAMASEKPLEMCVQYIRDNPDEFID